MLTLSIFLYIPLALLAVVWICVSAAKRTDRRERRAQLGGRPPEERTVPEAPYKREYMHP